MAKNVFFSIQTRFSLTTSVGVGVVASASSSSSFTVDYLSSSCGVPLKSAISIASSSKFQLKEDKIQRYDSVLDLLTSYGFDHTQIASITGKYPWILRDLKVDENLRPKLEYLSANGFSGSLLRDLIVSDPRILSRSLSSAFKPSLEFLRSILGSEESVYLAVKRHPRLIKNDLKGTLQPNIDLLVKEGVPRHSVIKFLISYPHLMIPSIDRLADALQTFKDQLGIRRSSDRKFLLTVLTIASVNDELLEKKVQVFKSFGFSQQQVLGIFRGYPGCMSRSEETLRTKLDFYLDTVKLKVDDLVSYPGIFGFAIETRSRPRHNVLKLLLSKDLLKGNTKLARIFTISEEEFLNKYVINHAQQMPILLEMYYNHKIEKKIDI